MASSTIYLPQSSTSGRYISGRIDWTSTANNSANTSDITCNLYVRKGDTTMILTTPTDGTWSYSLSINGSNVTGTVRLSVLEDWVLVYTRTVTGISHNNDGSKSIAVSGSVTAPSATSYAGHVTSGSGTATFDKIPRASAISSVGNVTLGNACNVKWTPASANLRYKLEFSMGSWRYTTGAIHPNRTTLYTYDGYAIPLAAANQIPNSDTGTMSVTLYTYSDSEATAQIGVSDPKTFTVTVPNNSETKPAISMTLTPVSSLSSDFAGLYIQGKTKVKATLTATGKNGATITSYGMKMDGTTYGAADSYTSVYLSGYGSKTIYGYANDSRKFTGETSQQINVIAYQDPKLENVSAVRCDKNGNESEQGTYLKIKANIRFEAISGKNTCKVQYCYSQNGQNYTDWATILENTQGTAEVNTNPLVGTLSTQVSYTVKVRAIDEIGNPAESLATVSTEKVYCHRDGKRNALGLGKYNERDNAVDSAWDFYMNGKKVTGLPTPTDSTDAVPLGLLKDYVVEQGVDGNWTYRKWSSGIAELWGIATTTMANGSVMQGRVSYPFALSGTIYGIGTLNDAGGNAEGALPWNMKLTYDTSLCEVWVHNSGSVGFTSSTNLKVSIYIMGRWK
jgi:hypothetical protein